jgi:hypothetical protein
MFCVYCSDTSTDLRPYGPNGSMVCFKCAMESPERTAQAEHQLSKVLDACGDVIVMDEKTGPRPPSQEELATLNLNLPSPRLH